MKVFKLAFTFTFIGSEGEGDARAAAFDVGGFHFVRGDGIVLERGDDARCVQKLRESEPECLKGLRDLHGLLGRELDEEAVHWHLPSGVAVTVAVVGGNKF